MSSELLDDLFFGRAKKIMSILGVWIPPTNESTAQKSYKIFMLILQYSFLFFQIIYVMQVLGDLEAVSEAVYLLFTQACLCCKITVFHVNIDIIRMLIVQMNSDAFKPQCKPHNCILKRQARKIKRLLLSFIVAAETTCSIWGIKPLFDDVGIRKYPFDMWMPIKPDKSPQYELGYIFQELTICMSALMYFGVDSVAISMVIFACAQMEIIMNKMMSVSSYTYLNKLDDDARNRTEYYVRGNQKLIECVKQYQAVVRFTELVEDAFHIYFLFQLTGTVGIIVMSAFRILVVEQNSMLFISLIVYLIVMTSQMFLCCWSGHELTATSEELHTALYMSKWYEQDVKFQRTLCFAMTRMSRPLVLRAGHYISLSRQTFVSILRMSYSYIAVLNQTKMATNIDLFLGRPRIILKYLGIWMPPEKYIILLNIYKCLVMFTQFSFILFEFVYVAVVWGDIDEVSEASYLLFTQASVCYKTTVFMMNKENLKDLLRCMVVDTFAPQSVDHEKILSSKAKTIKNLCAVFLTSAITTCTLWAIMPLFDTAETRFFPFKIWMPVDPEKSPHYEIGYFYQMISIYISALLFFAVDSTALSMIIFGCAELEIIIDKVKKLQSIPMTIRLKKDVCKQMENENNKLLNECIQQHQAVVKFIEMVENTYHANIFFQLSGTVGIICIIGLRITIVKPSSVQFYSMLNYMVTMLSQLFLYCWCGNELTTKSQELREYLYLCPWYDQNAKFRRSLIIVMERMKRPIIFRAGHYIPLSRPTFVSILRSSYSYFAVLNQTKNK
ncbi:uncharacterized protein LOC123699915 [Colias croceus]|uniref:uncharacterized protein LOC123699915 n=1 Tax=Colias crocea TaxID=72248 RepID=UPI001E27C57A|nr:uncharacterized protein LOC123699915 [Colias croceus]